MAAGTSTSTSSTSSSPKQSELRGRMIPRVSVLLLGQTGAGKSTLGSILVNPDGVEEGCYTFGASSSLKSHTRVASDYVSAPVHIPLPDVVPIQRGGSASSHPKVHIAGGEAEGRGEEDSTSEGADDTSKRTLPVRLHIADTAGFHDTDGSEKKEKEIETQAQKALLLLAGRLDVCLLLVPLSAAGRFNKDRRKALERAAVLFTHDIYKRTIVVFTHCDDLINDHLQRREKLSPAEFKKKCRSGAIPQDLNLAMNSMKDHEALFTSVIRKPGEKGGELAELTDIVDRLCEGRYIFFSFNKRHTIATEAQEYLLAHISRLLKVGRPGSTAMRIPLMSEPFMDALVELARDLKKKGGEEQKLSEKILEDVACMRKATEERRKIEAEAEAERSSASELRSKADTSATVSTGAAIAAVAAAGAALLLPGVGAMLALGVTAASSVVTAGKYSEMSKLSEEAASRERKLQELAVDTERLQGLVTLLQVKLTAKLEERSAMLG